MEKTILEIIIPSILWTLVIIATIWLIKKSYIPYRQNLILIIMYGGKYYDAMIGIRGMKIDRRTGDVVVDEKNRRKGILWGLIPGRFYLYPFFHLKNDIKLIITEKKQAQNVLTTDTVKFKNGNMAVVFREITTDYLYAETTYYFGFKDLETGNDHLKMDMNQAIPDLDLSKIDDPEIKKFSLELDQVLRASQAIQGQVQDLENIDVEIVLADVVKITNANKYVFQQKDWYNPKETVLKSAIREICAENSYSSLVKMQSETNEVMISRSKTKVTLAEEINKDYTDLNLGHQSLKIKLEEVDLGEKSTEIAESLEKIQQSKRAIVQKIYDTITGFLKLRLFSKKVDIAKNAVLDIKGKADASVEKKWDAIQESKLTHYFESANSGPGSTGSGTDIAEFQKLLSFLTEEKTGNS